MTLADEDTNSILADNARRAIQGNEAMQVMQVMQAMQAMQVMQVMKVMQVMQVIQDRIYTEKVTITRSAIYRPNLELMQVGPSGGQIWNQCKWRHLVDNFVTNANCAVWWSNL